MALFSVFFYAACLFAFQAFSGVVALANVHKTNGLSNSLTAFIWSSDAKIFLFNISKGRFS